LFVPVEPKNTGTQGQFRGRDSSGSTKVEPPEAGFPTLAEQGCPDKKFNATVGRIP
jgi:hypothetical protein